MPKGILATALLPITLYLFSFKSNHFAAENSTMEMNDSLLLVELMDSFRLAQFEEYFEESENLTIEYMDSVFYYENRLTWYGLSISYTPDSLYKIVIYEGEGCGAYCNPNYESEILTKDNGKLGSLPGYLFPIDKMHILKGSPKTYVIIQNVAGKPAGFYSSIGQKASIIDMSSIPPKEICLPQSIGEIYDCSLRVEVPHFVDFDATINYNPNTSVLQFEYLAVDVYAEDMMATDSIIRGEVTFSGDGNIALKRSAVENTDSTNYGF